MGNDMGSGLDFVPALEALAVYCSRVGAKYQHSPFQKNKI